MDWIQGRWRYEHDTLVRERVQDVEPILDQNKRFQNEPQKKSELMGHHRMSIPMVLIEKWINEGKGTLLTMGKQEADKFLRRIYNDPDYRWLRTR